MSRLSKILPEYLKSPLSHVIFLLGGSFSVVISIFLLMQDLSLQNKLLIIASWIALVVAFQPWKKNRQKLVLGEIIKTSLYADVYKYLINLSNISDEEAISECSIEVVSAEFPTSKTVGIKLPDSKNQLERVSLSAGENCNFDFIIITPKQTGIGAWSAYNVVELRTPFIVIVRATGHGSSKVERSVKIDPLNHQVEYC